MNQLGAASLALVGEFAGLEEAGDSTFAVSTVHAFFMAIGGDDRLGTSAGDGGVDPHGFAFGTHHGMITFRGFILGSGGLERQQWQGHQREDSQLEGLKEVVFDFHRIVSFGFAF